MLVHQAPSRCGLAPAIQKSGRGNGRARYGLPTAKSERRRLRTGSGSGVEVPGTGLASTCVALPPGESPAGYPRRAMLGAPRYRRTGCAGSARLASTQGSAAVGRWRWVRRGLLRQVVRKRAVPDAGGSLSACHEGRFTGIPPGLAGLACRAREPAAAGSRGRCPAVAGDGLVEVRGRAGATFVRGCRVGHVSLRGFGYGPRRPCLVANPGGGAGFMSATFQIK